MKKIILAAVLSVLTLGFQAQALDLKGILGGLGNLGNAGNVVSGIVDGLFTQSDITVEQMAGTWTATGSAVCFQSENYLKKAGGAAVASTIESKLNPYYQQYGLTGSVLTVETSGKFSLKVKNITLSGTVTKRSDGNFDFAFSALGGIKIGAVKAYVERTTSGLNVMFDASKLKSLLTTLTTLTGNSLAKSAGSLLDGYDGLCVGFAFTGTGTGNNSSNSVSNIVNSIFNSNSSSDSNASPATNQNSNSNSNTNSNTNSNSNSTINKSSVINSVSNSLKNLFGK